MRVIIPLLILAAGCARDAVLPQYMQALPKSDEEARRISAKIRRELGKDARVERVEGYFFVATNDSARSFQRCRRTIGSMFRYLHRDYFDKNPEKPIRIYLFRDRKSYEAYCEATYDEPPSTPFGFYMAGERKMVMNIATGTGTLAHELVHPLLSEDFPQEVPAWFNEGFASLFEQSGPRGDKIVGHVNWRLPALQKALHAETSVPLRDLLAMKERRFYGDDRGVNYAAARYLCYWLQEHDKLIPFYREFKKAAKKDPTGAATLEKVAGKKLEDLEKAWGKWVLELRDRS